MTAKIKTWSKLKEVKEPAYHMKRFRRSLQDQDTMSSSRFIINTTLFFHYFSLLQNSEILCVFLSFGIVYAWFSYSLQLRVLLHPKVCVCVHVCVFLIVKKFLMLWGSGCRSKRLNHYKSPGVLVWLVICCSSLLRLNSLLKF